MHMQVPFHNSLQDPLVVVCNSNVITFSEVLAHIPLRDVHNFHKSTFSDGFVCNSLVIMCIPHASSFSGRFAHSLHASPFLEGFVCIPMWAPFHSSLLPKPFSELFAGFLRGGEQLPYNPLLGRACTQSLQSCA